jgi:hypothetical protein
MCNVASFWIYIGIYLTMHGPINVKSPNNTSKWQMGFNSAFKGLRCMKLQSWIRLFLISWRTCHSAAPPAVPTAILSNGWTQGLTWLGSNAFRNFYHKDGSTSFPTACCASATINDVHSDFHSMDVKFESPWFLSYPLHPFRVSTL